MANSKTVFIVYTPVGTTYKLHLPDRIRKAVVNRAVEVTGGTLNRYGVLDGCRFGTEDAVHEMIAQEYPDWTVSVQDERAVAKQPGDRVKWSDVERQWSKEHRGYVGVVQLFKVYTTTVRGDQTPYRLSTTLPSTSTENDPYPTQEAAERAAESVLETFLRKLGLAIAD